MDLKEMRAKDIEALTKELSELYKAGFSLRMQHATQQLSDSPGSRHCFVRRRGRND